MTLVGRTAAVTGSFGAIGSAVSKALTELGAHVVAIDVADTASSSTNDRITPLHLDLSDANAIAAAASELTKTFGSVDILANNAGVLSNNKAQGLGPRDRQAINDAQSASCSGSPPCDHHARDAARRGGVRAGLGHQSTRQETASSSHEERRPGREQTTARILLHGPTVGRLRFQPSRPAPSLPHQVPNERAENAGIP
jgi:NAD(P)-dependent dehydrogenase (short-subunit alcohol dehydrogenase family)